MQNLVAENEKAKERPTRLIECDRCIPHYPRKVEGQKWLISVRMLDVKYILPVSNISDHKS